MKYSNEEEIKQALGVESWRNLSRKNVVRFAAMMPDMDKELALKIVQQFPAFTRFALEGLRTLEKMQESALGFNEHSQQQVHDAYQDVRDAIRGELNRDLTSEERQSLLEMMMTTAEKESTKDSENKRLISDFVRTTAAVTGGVLLAAVVVLGAKVVSEQAGDMVLEVD